MAALATLACADVIGIPDAPHLASPPAPPPRSRSTSTDPLATRGDTTNPAGPLPIRDAGTDLGAHVPDAPPSLPPFEPPPAVTAAATDAGAGAVADAAPAPDPACDTEGAHRGLGFDIVLILDNSGSMPSETASVEALLPDWANLLDARAIDYRFLLVSRHRTDSRTATEAASTSICVEQPLSGLEACPSAAPVPGSRFLHYSVKVDATDSLERALAGFAAPDALGLNPGGWSAGLRPLALTVFVEISDADSALPAADFVAGLQAASASQFGNDPQAPTFVFHSVVGLLEKSPAELPYSADEPLQGTRCVSELTDPDDAGVQYQALSRLTGGLRFPLCPSAAIATAMLGITVDLQRRSAERCPE